MANAIVTLLDKAGDAEKLVQDLVKGGFDKSRVNTIAQGSASNVVSSLTTMNVPQESAQFYQEGVKRGGTLVTLDVEDNDIDRAMEIINRYETVDVNTRADEFRKSGFSDFNLDQQGEVALPVVEEELRVGKRAVERGGVRVFSRVIERPVEETVSLREEKVTVERRPVDRTVTNADLNTAFKEGSLEVTERGEEVVTDKQARVVEEVVVGKDVTERAETVRDTVRRTDVEVEEITGTETETRAKSTTNKS